MEAGLKRLSAELEAAIDGASAEALQNAPAGKWNSAQILEHLFLTYQNTNRAIAKCVDGDAPIATTPTIKHRLKCMIVTGLGYFPEGAKAPERAMPRGMPLEEIRGTIQAEIQKMAAGLDYCQHRFGAQTKIIDHPILGPLTANEWRKFHLVHARHHARQIRERVHL